MLLALRRWLGLSTPVVETADEVVDRKSQKWVIEPARVGLIARAEELWREKFERWVRDFIDRVPAEEFDAALWSALTSGPRSR